jgi:hypothetical protein
MNLLSHEDTPVFRSTPDDRCGKMRYDHMKKAPLSMRGLLSY